MATENLQPEFPDLPFPPNQLLPNLAKQQPPNLRDAFAPFYAYESQLRSIFAQQPEHPVVSDPLANLVPVFEGHQHALKTHARNPESQTDAVNDTYILPLSSALRREHGLPAVVSSLDDFKRNFSIFSESSLSELDWSNVVAAGSSVVTSLLPVPSKYDSKRGRREYYHKVIAPASDIDLFLYGLDEEQAIAKIKQIESCIKDSQLKDVTTIRTKNAITIASGYPTRHVQIVLRIYKSISEILTGFDVDCSCAAFDGTQVYASPRALLSYMTQVNTIDITRRSPSYENRLFKYHKRGFEICWPQLDRSRIDPTIFERSFVRVQGLARLLVLEKIPEPSERQKYAEERREQRGRPQLPPMFARTNWERQPKICKGWKADMKQNALGEGPDGVEGSALSSYHTFTVPYGPMYNAKKTEKLLYTQDLLLNATWNKPPDREVDLHRHPAFFGSFEDVIKDCCGCCPVPTSHEERKVAEEESKAFISGEMTFIKDDPGRQAIGSFHPLTDDDWTAMAYAGAMDQVSKAVLEDDVDFVQKWCEQEGNDVDRRDSGGRTLLHLAVMSSTPRVVQCLIDHGVRIVARLVDGRTALHLAAFRDGDVGRDIVRSVLRKSEANREDHSSKVEAQRSGDANASLSPESDDVEMSDDHEESEDSGEDPVVVSAPSEGPDMKTSSDISVVNVDKVEEQHAPNEDSEEILDDPDIYDVDVPAWDDRASALHLAIVTGNTAVAEELVQNFGANLTIPVIIPDIYDPAAKSIILPLVLASHLNAEKRDKMIKTLLDLGATSAQADRLHITALHRFAANKFVRGVQMLLEYDKPAAHQAMNYIAVSVKPIWAKRAASPLISAASQNDLETAKVLLHHGAKANITFDDFIPHLLQADKTALHNSSSENRVTMLGAFEQPIIHAAQLENIELVKLMLDNGVDVNTLSNGTQKHLLEQQIGSRRSNAYNNTSEQSLLDIVRASIRVYAELDVEQTKDKHWVPEPLPLPAAEGRMAGLTEGTFKHWRMQRDINESQATFDSKMKTFKSATENDEEEDLVQMMTERKAELLELELYLLERGAKSFNELHPDHEKSGQENARPNYTHGTYDCKVASDYQLPDLNETVRAGYDELFEAAWTGDVTAIKSLCLRNWGPERKQQPLLISTSESGGFNPFAVAVLRGHVDCASEILKIVEAQYEPPEKEQPKKVMYELSGGDDEAEDGDEESEGDDDDELPRFNERTIDDENTTDILTGLSRRVKSHTTAWSVAFTFLQRSKFDSFPTAGLSSEGAVGPEPCTESEGQWSSSLASHAIRTNRIALFKKLHEFEQRYLETKTPDGAESDFGTALKYGRVDAMQYLVSLHGAGLPLKALIGQSQKDKPDFSPNDYPGLTVRGRKIYKWARQRSYGQAIDSGVDTHYTFSPLPPLLHAVGHLNVSAVRWLLSQSPLQAYIEVVQRLSHDGFKALAARDDLEELIGDWLASRSELALHYVSLTTNSSHLFKPEKPRIDISKMLIQHVPAAINGKEPSYGATPLLTAFAFWNYDVAKLLIEAGADQNARDKFGRNVMHVLLNGIAWNQHNRDSVIPVAWLQDFMALLDPAVLEQLLQQRSSGDHCSEDFLSQTPLAAFMTKNSKIDPVRDADVLDALAAAAPGSLDMLDGAGDTPLHLSVRQSRFQFVVRILRRRPDLLWRENGTGRTPADMARDRWLRNVFAGPPIIWGIDNTDNHRAFYNYNESTANKGSLTLLKNREEYRKRRTGGAGEPVDAVWQTFDVCERELCKAENASRKRRLVSLFEANAVAERLAKRTVAQRKRTEKLIEQHRRYAEGEEDERVIIDVFNPQTRLCQ